MPEPPDDAGNDLSVPVSTDQDVISGTPVREGHDQLLGVPERDDEMMPLPVEFVDGLLPAHVQPHGPAEEADERGADRRQHRELQPVPDALLQTVSDANLITHHSSRVTRL
jgi:hypothetical protein